MEKSSFYEHIWIDGVFVRYGLMTLMMDMISEILSIEKCCVVVRHKATRALFTRRRFAMCPIQEYNLFAILLVHENCHHLCVN